MQSVEGVSYVNVEKFDSVAEGTTVKELAHLASTLTRKDRIVAAGATPGTPAELVFLTPEIPNTLILNQLGV